MKRTETVEHKLRIFFRIHQHTLPVLEINDLNTVTGDNDAVRRTKPTRNEVAKVQSLLHSHDERRVFGFGLGSSLQNEGGVVTGVLFHLFINQRATWLFTGIVSESVIKAADLPLR